MAWGGTLLLVLLATPVSAEDAVLLNTEAVLADGTTSTRLEILWPGLAPGDQVSARSRRIGVQHITVPGPGLLRIDIVPRPIELPEEVDLSIQVKGENAKSGKVHIALIPASPGALQLSLDPPVIQPGEAGITIRVTPTMRGRIGVSERPLLAKANLGKVEGLAPLDDGTWLARYVPPTRLGGTATDLVLIADPTSPDQVIGYAAIPIEVTRKKHFETLWGAQNILTVGERTYGPIISDAGGRVSFELQLNPAHPTGILESIAEGGRKTTTQVKLHPGSPSEIAFFPPPVAVPVGRVVSLNLLAVKPGGAPWIDADPILKDGNVFVPIKEGIYQARYTAPLKPGPWVVEATAGDRTARVTIQVVEDLPHLELRAEPEELSEGLQDLRIHSRLTDSGGRSLDSPVELTVSGANLISGPKDTGPGLTDWWLRPSASVQQVRASASPRLPSTGLPTSQILLWSTQHALRPGRVGELRIASVDAYGLPVPRQSISLAIDVGDAEVAEKARTDGNGVAHVRLRPGSEPGLVVIRASAGSIQSHLAIWLATGPAAPSGATGSQATQQLTERYSALHPMLRVSRPEVEPESPQLVDDETSDLSLSAALRWLRTGVPEEEPEAPPPAPAAPDDAPTQPAVAAPAPPAQVAVRKPAPGPYFGAVRLQAVHQNWQHTHSSDEQGPFPATYSFGGPEAEAPSRTLGLLAALEVWPRQSAYGLEVSWRASTVPVKDEDVTTLGAPDSLFMGARYRQLTQKRLRLHASLGAHRGDALVFRYLDDGRTQLAVVDLPIWSLRPSVGVELAFYRWQGRIEAGENFAGSGFWPIDTWGSATLDIPMHSALLTGIYISSQFEYHNRSMQFASGESQAEVEDSQRTLTVGIGTHF